MFSCLNAFYYSYDVAQSKTILCLNTNGNKCVFQNKVTSIRATTARDRWPSCVFVYLTHSLHNLSCFSVPSTLHQATTISLHHNFSHPSFFILLLSNYSTLHHPLHHNNNSTGGRRPLLSDHLHSRGRLEDHRTRLPTPHGSLPQKSMEHSRFRHRRFWVNLQCYVIVR